MSQRKHQIDYPDYLQPKQHYQDENYNEEEDEEKYQPSRHAISQPDRRRPNQQEPPQYDRRNVASESSPSNRSYAPNREIQIQPRSLQSISENLPSRPAHPRKKGEHKLAIITNMFGMHFKIEHLTKYDIEFDPIIPEDARTRRAGVIEKVHGEIREIYGEYFFDNTRLYAVRTIKDEQTFKYGKDCSFTLKFGQTLKLHEIDTQYKKQMAGIMLQTLLKRSGLFRIGRDHFDMQKQNRINITTRNANEPQHLTLIPGYRTSLDTTMNGISVGIDARHRLMEDRTIRELMDEIWTDISTVADFNLEQCSKNFEHRVLEALQNRSCLIMGTKKVYTIDDIDFTKTIHDPIDDHEYSLSIKEYWQQHYNIDCLNEENGMILTKLKTFKGENQDRWMLIPPEACVLTGFGRELRNKRNVMTAIAKKTKVNSTQKYLSTNRLVEKLSQVAQNDINLKDIIQVENSLTNINAILLDTPNILIKKNDSNEYCITGPEKLIDHFKNGGFFEMGDNISNWAIAYEYDAQQYMEDFDNTNMIVGNMRKYADESGVGSYFDGDENNINYIEIPLERNNQQRHNTWGNTIFNYLKQHSNIKIVIGVLPKRANDKTIDEIYSAIKTVCSVSCAVFSQCILAKNANNRHVIIGILRQILIKLGSIPWKIQFNLKYNKYLNISDIPTMICGVNVNHDRSKNCSVVGFAASYDRDFVRYMSDILYQKQGKELISDLQSLMEGCLTRFKQLNQCYPKQIIFYRDGVSETQIEQCVKHELRHVQDAINKLCGGINHCKLIFIGTQKRVNARFIMQSNYLTAPPGTCVNSDVVSNQYWDFYIVPAKPPENLIAIPTRFVVLKDDLNLGKDGKGKGEHCLMSFTNSLCSLYFNWPGPTRVPAPIKYAAKIAQQYCQSLSQSNPHHRLACSYHFL